MIIVNSDTQAEIFPGAVTLARSGASLHNMRRRKILLLPTSCGPERHIEFSVILNLISTILYHDNEREGLSDQCKLSNSIPI